jgi:hypothetical protein
MRVRLGGTGQNFLNLVLLIHSMGAPVGSTWTARTLSSENSINGFACQYPVRPPVWSAPSKQASVGGTWNTVFSGVRVNH